MDIKSFLNSFKMKVPEGGSSQFTLVTHKLYLVQI
jgi:hypothetical protein